VTTGFFRAGSELVCDGVPISAIASQEGTPLYVYSAETIRSRFRAIDGAFGGYPHAVHYALKANSTFAIVQLVRALGGAVDANSIWEIDVARRARMRRAPRPQSDQRRVGRRARAGRGDFTEARHHDARGDPHQPGH
jgi:diaminopimelate decarboxylase